MLEEPSPLPGRGPAGAPTGPWLARVGRGLGGRTSAPSNARPQNPPTPAPTGLPGPASLVLGPPRAAGCLVAGYYPGPPTRIPTPVYPPWYPTRYAPTSAPSPVHTAGYGTTGTCTYDRFWTPRGEPRGIRTHPYFRVPGWFIPVGWFTRPFDWVFRGFMTSFTVFRTCFTVFRTLFTEFRTLFY